MCVVLIVILMFLMLVCVLDRFGRFDNDFFVVFSLDCRCIVFFLWWFSVNVEFLCLFLVRLWFVLVWFSVWLVLVIC